LRTIDKSHEDVRMGGLNRWGLQRTNLAAGRKHVRSASPPVKKVRHVSRSDRLKWEGYYRDADFF
jgi:hypothetical protein